MYTDFYILTTSKYAGINFYLNNLGFLQKIITLFSQRLKKENRVTSMYKYKIKECKVKCSPFIDQKTFPQFDIIQLWKHQSNELTKNYPICTLTQREQACVKLVMEGYTAKEIGRCFGISPRTVETHCKNIKTKLHVRSKKDILNYFS